MVDMVFCIKSLLFLVIPLFYYINLNSSIISCLSSRVMFLSFSISVSLSTVSEVFRGDVCLILLSTLLPIKSPAADLAIVTVWFF